MFIRLATDEQKRDIGLKRNCDPPTDSPYNDDASRPRDGG